MAIKALQEVAPVHGMNERFLALLLRAREIKQSTAVEPELPPLEIIEDVKALGAEFSGPLQHTLVEAIAQDIMYHCVVSIVLPAWGVALTSNRHLHLSMIRNSSGCGTCSTLFRPAKRLVCYDFHCMAIGDA